MRARSGFSLDDDVVDNILTCMPDFASLFAFAATCRAIRAVYVQHQASTLRSVASNTCGPEWIYALRPIRARAAREKMEAEQDVLIKAARDADPELNEYYSDGEHYSDEDEDDEDDEDDDDDDDDDDEDEDNDNGSQRSNKSDTGAPRARRPERPSRWVMPVIPNADELSKAHLTLPESRALEALGSSVSVIELQFSQR
jgi:hypothetical protein